MSKLKNEIFSLCKQLENEFDQISSQRKNELKILSEAILDAKTKFGKASIIVICTHNSRRSHLGQIWLQVASKYYGVEGVEVYSGGTEATAFNHRMINALKDTGFEISKETETENPLYLIQFLEEDVHKTLYFSKKFEQKVNPQKDFIAIMVCDSADANCPFVPGSFKRISLPYKDPKDFDNTTNEAKAYSDKVREMGREMLFVLKFLK